MLYSGFLIRSQTIGKCRPYFLSTKPKYTSILAKRQLFGSETYTNQEIIGQIQTTEIRKSRWEAIRMRRKNSMGVFEFLYQQFHLKGNVTFCDLF